MSSTVGGPFVLKTVCVDEDPIQLFLVPPVLIKASGAHGFPDIPAGLNGAGGAGPLSRRDKMEAVIQDKGLSDERTTASDKRVVQEVRGGFKESQSDFEISMHLSTLAAIVLFCASLRSSGK